MPHFYISFANVHGCLGATVVEVDCIDLAVPEATRRGINPGGEAAIWSIPPAVDEDDPVWSFKNRLVQPDELFAKGGRKVGDLTEDEQDAASISVDGLICEDCNRRPS